MITETCSCGSVLAFEGSLEPEILKGWRDTHAGCQPVPPGPCWQDAGHLGPSGPFRCELLAGHEGAHESDRGQWGGTATWPQEPSKQFQAARAAALREAADQLDRDGMKRLGANTVKQWLRARAALEERA